jgi:hypothetical protein
LRFVAFAGEVPTNLTTYCELSKKVEPIELRTGPLEWTKERPSSDGHYWMRWQGQTVGIFYVWRGRFYHGLTEQHPPTDAEWLSVPQPI